MLFIVSSVAGAGKTTLVDYATRKFNLYKLKTCTTRPVRDEEQGDEYHFMSRERFLEKISNGDFIEYATVYDNFYGLTEEEIDSNDDKDCIVILDVQGARTAKALYPGAVTIFIAPPPIEDLKKRLSGRNTGTVDMDRRIQEIQSELANMPLYDHIIHSGSLLSMKCKMRKLLISYDCH